MNMKTVFYNPEITRFVRDHIIACHPKRTLTADFKPTTRTTTCLAENQRCQLKDYSLTWSGFIHSTTLTTRKLPETE